MIRHLLKLSWNRRKKNLILGIEIMISFLVLFAIFSIGVDFFVNYLKDRGFEYEKVYSVRLDWQNEPSNIVVEKKERIAALLSGYNEVENFSFAMNNVPYSLSQWHTGFRYDNRDIYSDIFYVDDSFLDVLNIKLTGGDIFSRQFDANKTEKVIINERFTGEIADKTSILGKKITEGGPENSLKEYQVIGTFKHFKYYNDYAEIGNQIFVRTSRSDTVRNLNTLLIKMKESTNAVFEQKLMKDLSMISPNWTFDVTLLKENKERANMAALGPFILFSVIAGFLVFNVALGIFGVLWYSINRRKSEIGLRRAMGATATIIKKQFVFEIWMLTSLALSIAIFIAVQFPLLGVFDVKPAIYIHSIILSILFVFALVTICAYRPSVIAARIQPADSLKEE